RVVAGVVAEARDVPRAAVQRGVVAAPPVRVVAVDSSRAVAVLRRVEAALRRGLRARRRLP
ncbi:hypothetical protein, partial [Myxococcus sp. AM011]|uniref:hypothetical protein n=1 Tax=Myxococcus sp. AM011 TaxID=2745200 RepID=UPI001C3E011F